MYSKKSPAAQRLHVRANKRARRLNIIEHYRYGQYEVTIREARE